MSDEARFEEIRGIVGRFLTAAQLDVSPEVRREDEAFVVDLVGPDEDLLLDRRGELLESIQFLLAKILQRALGFEHRFLVDCANYRHGREREIAEVARRSAARVKKLSAPLELSPMNPYERRIVHLALKDDPGVRTESAGDGYLKRVVIYPGTRSV